MNTAVLGVSSVTGSNMSALVNDIATVAMSLPHVNESVPWAYRDFGAALQALGRELRAVGKPPVCSLADVSQRIGSCTTLGPRLPQDKQARALDFLASGGTVVLARDGSTVILDPGWLADTLACVITADPARLALLPPDLAEGGYLPHDPAALAAVWPDAQGYTEPLRGVLLSLLHRFDLAYELRNRDGGSLRYSLVPCMLPPDVGWGGASVDDLLGALGAGESEASVTYRLEVVPPDLWSLVVVRCAVLAVPEACTNTTAVLQFNGQRALVSLDSNRAQLSLCCRGVAPMDLRGRFHGLLSTLVADKFPDVMSVRSLYVVCPVCKEGSLLAPRHRDKVTLGKTFRCAFCREVPPRVLEVLDLVEAPHVTLDKALEGALPGAASCTPDRLCALAARAVDVVLGPARQDAPRVWLPLPTSAVLQALASATGLSASGRLLQHQVHTGVVWLPVCESKQGWHVVEGAAAHAAAHAPPHVPVWVGGGGGQGFGLGRGDDVALDPTALKALAPLLHRVARTVCATNGHTIGGTLAGASAAYLASAWLGSNSAPEEQPCGSPGYSGSAVTPSSDPPQDVPPVSSGSWAFDQDGVWYDMDLATSRLLTTCQLGGGTRCEFMRGDVRYVVDLVAMTQTNTRSGYVRSVRVVLPPPTHLGAVAGPTTHLGSTHAGLTASYGLASGLGGSTSDGGGAGEGGGRARDAPQSGPQVSSGSRGVKHSARAMALHDGDCEGDCDINGGSGGGAGSGCCGFSSARKRIRVGVSGEDGGNSPLENGEGLAGQGEGEDVDGDDPPEYLDEDDDDDDSEEDGGRATRGTASLSGALSAMGCAAGDLGCGPACGPVCAFGVGCADGVGCAGGGGGPSVPGFVGGDADGRGADGSLGSLLEPLPLSDRWAQFTLGLYRDQEQALPLVWLQEESVVDRHGVWCCQTHGTLMREPAQPVTRTCRPVPELVGLTALVIVA